MEERKRILNLLQEGKITADQADNLLKAIMDKKEDESSKIEVISTPSTKINANLKGKLKIIVESQDGDNVKITLPLKVAALAKNMIPQDAKIQMQKNGVNLGEIINNLDALIEDIDEDLVNVESQDGDIVRIFIEK